MNKKSFDASTILFKFHFKIAEELDVDEEVERKELQWV